MIHEQKTPEPEKEFSEYYNELQSAYRLDGYDKMTNGEKKILDSLIRLYCIKREIKAIQERGARSLEVIKEVFHPEISAAEKS